jgi:hypothetical protein
VHLALHNVRERFSVVLEITLQVVVLRALFLRLLGLWLLLLVCVNYLYTLFGLLLVVLLKHLSGRKPCLLALGVVNLLRLRLAMLGLFLVSE